MTVTLWSANYVKRVNSEGRFARLPKPLVLRDHARCVITGSHWRRKNTAIATASEDGQEFLAENHSQVRGVYIIPPKMVPPANLDQTRPELEGEDQGSLFKF
jgi:hypothetical protein